MCVRVCVCVCVCVCERERRCLHYVQGNYGCRVLITSLSHSYILVVVGVFCPRINKLAGRQKNFENSWTGGPKNVSIVVNSFRSMAVVHMGARGWKRYCNGRANIIAKGKGGTISSTVKILVGSRWSRRKSGIYRSR